LRKEKTINRQPLPVQFTFCTKCRKIYKARMRFQEIKISEMKTVILRASPIKLAFRPALEGQIGILRKTLDCGGVVFTPTI